MQTSQVLNVQLDHVSIRSFKQQDVSPEMLDQVLQAARRSPTSSNMQAYSIIVVRDQTVKSELSELAGGQRHVAECPVFLAFCADLNRLKDVCEMHGQEMNNNLETFLISTIDASLVGMSVQTGAESLGLGGVMIGAMRNRPAEVAKLLELPPHVYVVYGMCLGWPEERPPQKPRLPSDLVIHHEKYQLTSRLEAIRAHDREMAEHYEKLGKNLDQAAWSGVIARSLGRPLRHQLLGTLKDLGFNIAS